MASLWENEVGGIRVREMLAKELQIKSAILWQGVSACVRSLCNKWVSGICINTDTLHKKTLPKRIKELIHPEKAQSPSEVVPLQNRGISGCCLIVWLRYTSSLFLDFKPLVLTVRKALREGGQG